MPNWQELYHSQKPLLGTVAYIDLRVYKDLERHVLPHAFEIEMELHVFGAMAGTSGRVALQNGPIAVSTVVGPVRGTIKDWRGLLPDGKTSSMKWGWTDATSVAFRIDGLAPVTLPLGPLAPKITVDITHADFAVSVHRFATAEPNRSGSVECRLRR